MNNKKIVINKNKSNNKVTTFNKKKHTHKKTSKQRNFF
jgi:hypothetical protein